MVFARTIAGRTHHQTRNAVRLHAAVVVASRVGVTDPAAIRKCDRRQTARNGTVGRAKGALIREAVYGVIRKRDVIDEVYCG